MRLARGDVLITAVLAAITIAYCVAFHYRAPYFDHWDLAPLLEAAERGTLQPATLFSLHGGHWHAGAYALLIPLAQATGWSHLAETLLSLAFVGATAVLALRLALRFAAAAPQPALDPYVAIVAPLMFSLDQASNMLWGFQLSVFVSQFGVFLALWALCGAELRLARTLIAAAGLIVAVTSYATGFAVAPIGLALIALRNGASLARRILHGAIWTLISAVLVIAFVLAHRASPAGAPDLGHTAVSPDFLAYLAMFELVYLGSGLARFASDIVVPVGVLGVLIATMGAFVLAQDETKRKALAIPLALCAFGIGAGLLCALGRFEYGPDQGGNGRYITFSNTFWLGTALFALAAFHQLRTTAARRTAMGVFAMLLLLKVGNSVQAAVKHVEISNRVAAIAERMRDDPGDAVSAARQIAAETQAIEPSVAFMREKHWSAFANRRAP